MYVMSIKFNNTKLFRNIAVRIPETGYSTATLLHTLDNPNVFSTEDFDQFGWNVATDGTIVVVGAPTEDDPSTNVGRAYVFDATTGGLLHTLATYTAPPSDNRFGWSVEIDGNYIAVSEYDATSVGGAAHVFNATTGALVSSFTNPNSYNTASLDRFGQDISISGNYVLVGADLEDHPTGTSSGAAYIFNATTGALISTITNPSSYSTPGGDRFGNAVAIDGNYAIIGAYNEDDATGGSAGVAYIYKTDTGDWTDAYVLHTLTNPNNDGLSTQDRFSYESVDMEGTKAIIGAYSEGGNSGAVYVFDVITGNLLQTVTNPNPFSTPNNDRFGISSGISGDYAIVGADYEDNTGTTDEGKAYIIDINTGSVLAQLDNPNTNSPSSDYFGLKVAISGNIAVVGAYATGATNSGKAYIYQLS